MVIWTLPESPGWLIKDDRDGEAIAVLSKFRKADLVSDIAQYEIQGLKGVVELTDVSKKCESVFAIASGKVTLCLWCRCRCWAIREFSQLQFIPVPF